MFAQKQQSSSSISSSISVSAAVQAVLPPKPSVSAQLKAKFATSPASLLMLSENLKAKEGTFCEVGSNTYDKRLDSLAMQRQSPTMDTNDNDSEEMNDLSFLPTLLSLTKNNPLGQLINNNLNKQLTNAGTSGAVANALASVTRGGASLNASDVLNRENSESKRSRTQLTNGQVNAMQATFELYRSPSLAECEILGAGIGLARRVVQVRIFE